MSEIRVGPAGSCEEYTRRYKTLAFMPEFLTEYGLNAYEYQCGRGVNVNPDAAQLLCEKAEAVGIEISVHAPYFITLSGLDEQKRLNSINYILDSARAVKMLGGRRIVVHSGSCSKISRQEAVELASDTLRLAMAALDEQGLGETLVCPETMGKLNQLGTVEEVCALCLTDERMLPCVDFGHVNSMTGGGIKTADDYRAVLDLIQNRLGEYRLKNMHIHFSKIEYTVNGGEVRHLTFDDTLYGPEFDPLAQLIAQRGMTPFIVCESAGTQTRDAASMMGMLRQAR